MMVLLFQETSRQVGEMQIFSNVGRLTKSQSAPSLSRLKSSLSKENLSTLSEETVDVLSHTISDSSLNEIVSHCSQDNKDEQSFIRCGIDFVGETYQCWIEENKEKMNVDVLKFVRILARYGCKYVFTIASHHVWSLINQGYHNVHIELLKHFPQVPIHF